MKKSVVVPMTMQRQAPEPMNMMKKMAAPTMSKKKGMVKKAAPMRDSSMTMKSKAMPPMTKSGFAGK